MKWIHNNWRISKAPAAPPAPLVVKRTDVLWRLRQQEVWIEIADILGIDTADSHTPDWFSHRMVAMKNIISRMTSAELANLDNEVAQLAQKGYSQADQRK